MLRVPSFLTCVIGGDAAEKKRGARLRRRRKKTEGRVWIDQLVGFARCYAIWARSNAY